MPKTKRIVLVDGSRLLRGMMKRAIELDPQLFVVAEVDKLEKFSSVIQQARADWIFMTLPPGDPIPEVVDNTLREHPELRLMVMSTDGSRVRMRWIETHETSLDEKSLNEIMTILRGNGEKANLELTPLVNNYKTSRDIAPTIG